MMPVLHYKISESEMNLGTSVNRVTRVAVAQSKSASVLTIEPVDQTIM